MQINNDLTQRAIGRGDDFEWTPSPMAGVSRRMLDRMGEESGRATSIVRYDPGSFFSPHTHTGGEEYFVLDGVFSDENGDYPAGTYVRNPIGSRHKPFSKEGGTIFVKLDQFDKDDTQSLIINTRDKAFSPGLVGGLSVLPLHSFGSENIALVKWEPGTKFIRHHHFGGEEILVLEGVFEDEHGAYPAGTWLRSPHGSEHTPFSTQGALIYVKTGHLPQEAA